MSRIADAARTATDILTEPVDIPEWGVTIEVRGMDGNARAEVMQRIAEGRDDSASGGFTSIEPDLLVECCFDPEDGSKAFTVEDIPMLLSKSGAVINRLSAAVMRVSGLDKAAENKLGKGSGASPATVNDGSTSTSPAS